MANGWYCVTTHSRCEDLALANLNRQNFTTFLPTIMERHPKHGNRIVPLFPGYMFVAFDIDVDRWQPIANTYGVRRILSSAPENPTQVPDTLISELQASAEQRLTTHGTALIRPGCELRVRSGPLQRNTGICQLVAKDRVVLLMKIMHRQIEVTLNAHDLELVA